MRSRRIVLVLAFGAAAGILGGVLAHRFVPTSPVVRGIYIGERRLPDDRSAADWLAARRDAARSRKVRFYHGDQVFESTLGEAGVEIDVAATLERAEEIGHKGSMNHRIHEAEKARAGRVDVPISWSIDEAKARALFATYAPALARAPRDARLDLDKHLKLPDTPGQALYAEASLAALRAGTHDDEEAIPLVTQAIPAKITENELSQVDITKVVSAYETTFSLFGSGAGRAVNIRNAASKVDGTILPPGAIFSFNDTVGPRTKERGFTLAPEIQGDELQDGYGGGTCQASSTLHVAALYGALEIVERQAHSRPSAYTQLGLDATVSYPLADLKIRNTLPFPVMIHAYLPRPNAVRMEILGGDPVAKVDYVFAVNATEDFVRRVTVKSYLAPGRRIRRQKGSQGFDVSSVVRIHFLDGREEEHRYFSGYRPAPEVFWVGPGFDTGELPPLPDHAKGVEGSAFGGQTVAASAPGDVGG